MRNVLRCASNQPELAGTFLSRKPTGEKGKLAVLRRLFTLDSLVYHVDDSPEVLEEISNFIKANPQCAWVVLGFRVPRKWAVPGVSHYQHTSSPMACLDAGLR